MRVNFRPSARATDSPSDVLPTPGGPTSVMIAPEPRPATGCRCAALAPLLHGQELDDPLFDVVEPGMVLIEDAARLGDIEAILGPLAPGQLEHPIQVVADPAVLGVLLAGALEAPSSRSTSFRTCVGEGRLVDALPILRRDVAIALAQLALDRLELLAQVVLALALLKALVDFAADLVLEGDLRQDLAAPGDELLESLQRRRALRGSRAAVRSLRSGE